MKLALPKREHVPKTTWEDSHGLYYTPFIRDVYLHRFRLATALMATRRYQSLLDIGFGCGIFLKELSRHVNFLYGIDIHNNIEKVEKMAIKEGFSAQLVKASILSIPYESRFFECVISMSVLEHLRELNAAMREISRVARSGADIILGFPVRNIITNIFFRALGYAPKDIHPSSHAEILKTVKKHFIITKIMKFPDYLSINGCLYIVIKCKKC